MTQFNMNIHESVFDAINNGLKDWIICVDKGYHIGDTVRIVCVDDDGNPVMLPNYKDGRNVEFRCLVAVTYIQYPEDFELADCLTDNACVIGFKRIA